MDMKLIGLYARPEMTSFKKMTSSVELLLLAQLNFWILRLMRI
jgi:hypothetical protein